MILVLRFGLYMVPFILLFILVMFLRLRVEVHFTRKGEDDYLKLQVSMVRGLFRFKTEVPAVDVGRYLLRPVLKVKAGAEGSVSGASVKTGRVMKIPLTLDKLRKLPIYINKALELVDRYKKTLLKLLKKIRFHYLHWTTDIGLGDPADTGIAAGLLWGVKGFLYGLFQNYAGTTGENPKFVVRPCFNAACFRLDFHCIFDMRIGHIIIAGLKIVKTRLSPKFARRRKK